METTQSSIFCTFKILVDCGVANHQSWKGEYITWFTIDISWEFSWIAFCHGVIRQAYWNCLTFWCMRLLKNSTYHPFFIWLFERFISYCCYEPNEGPLIFSLYFFLQTTRRTVPFLFVRGDGVILVSPPLRTAWQFVLVAGSGHSW